MRCASLVVVFAVITAPVLACASGLDAQQRSRVDAVFQQYDASYVPGCALGIFRNGATVYARGYGMADLEPAAYATIRIYSI